MSRLTNLAAAAAVTVALTAALLTPTASAATATNEYGALAWSPVKRTVGYALASNRAAAESGAVKDCQAKGGSTNCVGFVWFQHGWGALAASSNGHVGWGWAWNTTSSAKARAAAVDYAVQGCSGAGGRGCRVVKDLATTGTPGRGAGGAGPYWIDADPNWHYVAAGDSYSAGKSNPPYLDATDCDRSPKAYGPRLRAAIPTLGKLAFIACSGAVTDDFYSFKQGLPQRAAVAALPNVLSLTLTIGGNDVGFGEIVNACIRGDDCRYNKQLVSSINGRLAVLRTGRGKAKTPDGRPIYALTKVLKDLHSAAPKARIFLGGYPRLFGKDTSKFHGPKHDHCLIGLGQQVSFAEAKWLNTKVNDVNKVLSGAVDAAKKDHVPATIVPVEAAYTTHGLCDTGTSWIRPLQVPDISDSLHPNLAGQTAYMNNFRDKEGL